MRAGNEVEIGVLGDANADFAANARKLSDLARRILAAQQVGDIATSERLIAEYRRLNGQLAPQQRASVKAALEKEMPSALMLRLSSAGDFFAGAFKSLPLTLVIVGALYFLFLKGGARGMRQWD